MVRIMRKHLGLLLLSVLICLVSLWANMKTQILKGQVLDKAILGELFGRGGSLLPLLLLFMLISVALAYLYSRTRVHIAQRCMRSLRGVFFRSYLQRDFRQHQSMSEDKLIAIYSQQLSQIEMDFFITLGLLIEMVLTVLFAIATLFALHPQMALGFTLLLSLPLFVPSLFEKRVNQASETSVKALTTFTASLTNVFKAFELIKNFQIENRIRARFDEYNESFRQSDMNFEKRKAEGIGVSFLVTQASHMGTAAIAAYFVLKGSLTAGEFLSVVSISGACSAPLSWIARYFQSLIASRAARRAVLAEIAMADPLELSVDPSKLTEKPCAVQCDNISFAYRADKAVIQDLSFSLEPGEHCLIQGPSGSGKSTLIDLLLSYYAPASGEIEIAGRSDLSSTERSCLISVSRQEARLFSDSLRNNLTLYDESISDTEICRILKQLGLEKWANPQGLELQLEAAGENLSGGERKRLSLARALLRNTPVLILDEPLANIDPENVGQIENFIESIKGPTLLVISHQGSEPFLQSFARKLVFQGGGRVAVRS